MKTQFFTNETPFCAWFTTGLKFETPNVDPPDGQGGSGGGTPTPPPPDDDEEEPPQ